MAYLRSIRSRAARTYPISSIRSLRSAPVTGTLPDAAEGVFQVFRAYEGVQLVIEWSVPTGGFDRVQIRRKLDAWPESVVDGTFIVEDVAPFSLGTFSDQEVEKYRVYYYTMYLHRASDDTWVTENRFRGKEFPLPTQYFEESLWKRLPTLYHREDGEG